MKHSYSSHAAVAHAWAHQVSDQGYTSDRRMFFEGDTIYSYGYHFAIAKKVGKNVVLFNRTNYSRTTVKHQNHVWRAIPDNWYVIRCFDPDGSVQSNFEEWTRRINDLEKKLKRATQPQKWLNDIISEYNLLKVYARQMKAKVPNGLQQKVARLKKQGQAEGWERRWNEHAQQLTEQRHLREQRAYQAHLESARMAAKRFVAGKTNYIYSRLQMLRFNEDKNRFQTSKGVEIPLEIGRRFWERLENGQVEVGDHLLSYDVWHIDGEEISIGCHTFRIPYLKHFGRKMFASE